jgi:ApaG protein
MTQRITQGIAVQVETFYNGSVGSAEAEEHTFAYRITIVNQSDFPVQLLKRHWIIFDSLGIIREVNGDGVVGQQPIIEPNQQFQYVSGTGMHTEIGKMGGSYTMQNLFNKQLFEVGIPDFELIVPHKMN